MSKLQFLYKKQMSILSDRMLYDRKKYLVMKRSESERKTQSQSIRLADAKKKGTISRDDLEILRAARRYKSSNKMVN